MKETFQRVLNLTLSLSLFLASPVGATTTTSVQPEPANDPEVSQDIMRSYWGQLDQQNPLLTEFALGEPLTDKPLWTVTGDNTLLDGNPYFMRSQSWVTANSQQQCDKSVCFVKTADGGVNLQLAGESKVLQLNEKFTPVLETRDYILLTADNDQIFRTKNPGEADPGEGLFFIAKSDLNKSYAFQAPVPVFFFPTPGPGWTGPNDQAFELETTDQIVVYNKDSFGLPIDRSDFALLEKVERNNLNLAQTWTILEGAAKSGQPLPKANATLAFGLILSGQMPQAVKDAAANGVNPLIKKIASSVSDSLLPQASAHEAEPTMKQILQDDIKARDDQLKEIETAPPGTPPKKSLLRRWLAPLIMYGGTAAAAIGIGAHVDWGSLITSDMPQRIATVSELLGTVLVASVAMKYSVHKAIFDKKYPKTADETWIQRLNKEHKGILDELVHGLWFSMAFLPQGIRHILDFFKDRFFPNNSMVHKAWEATMGYAMRQSSRLAMNWKTFYLGSIVFGMADSMMVAVHLLIFTPFITHYFGWDAMFGTGVATAAFASAEVLRNFLAYLQSGAHGYSQDVKMIHLKSAENEAKRIVSAKGLDPEAAKNEGLVGKLTQVEMEKRFKMVGLPSESEFLYDPITVLESVVAKAGFSANDIANLSDDDKKLIGSTDFVLTRRRWGLIKPALQRALQTAQDAQAKSPSATGEKVVNLLQWALGNRSLVKAVAERAYDTASSGWALDGMKEAMNKEVAAALAKGQAPNMLTTIAASAKGAVKYLAQDSTQDVRDIRQVLFLMSTSGSPLDVVKFFPKSWTDKAGSEDVSLLAAELFHRSFNGYLATDSNLINPDSAMEAAYGARTEAVMARISRRDPSLLADPFARQVRYWELMSRLQTRDKERLAVLNYQPKNQSAMAQRQWKIARDNAAARMAEQPVEEQVAKEWLGVANLFETKSGEEVVAGDWAKSYKYRFTVAQELAKQVGLTVNDVDKSDFVGKVIVAAAIKTEATLKNTGETFYMNKLSESDRKFYEAQVFTTEFVASYIDLSVRSDENMKASSLEFPGIGQGLRRKVVGLPGGGAMAAVIRSFEALWRNEETSYAPGIWAALDRGLPVIPDLVHNFFRNLRMMPYILTMSYLTSYYVWQIHIPYPLWAISVMSGFVATALVEFNNRLMRNHDIKPMDDVPSKLTYSFLHSNLTNPEVMLVQAVAQPVTEGFDGALATCEKILLGGK